jgi:predicted nucleic acid-binding protein
VIVYLDASALVKRYIEERGSDEVNALVAKATVVGTALISQVEVTAALAKGTRMGVLTPAGATRALEAFQEEWRRFDHLRVTEWVIERASVLAWEQRLRGYDAVHLASALFWQELGGERICMATYDRELWEAARHAGLEVFPVEKP